MSCSATRSSVLPGSLLVLLPEPAVHLCSTFPVSHSHYFPPKTQLVELKDASAYQCVVHSPTWATEDTCVDCVMVLLLPKTQLKFQHADCTKCFFSPFCWTDVITWCSLGLISRIYNWKTINTAQVSRSYWANYLRQPRVWIESAFSSLFWFR